MNVTAEAAPVRRISQGRRAGDGNAPQPCLRGDGRAGATSAVIFCGKVRATISRSRRASNVALWRPAALSAVALIVSSCATEVARTPQQRAADAALAYQVERALAQDPRIYARHIAVEVQGGVVHLSGFVWAADDYYEARHVAATVPGVAKVVDQLEMVVGGRSGAR